MAPLRVQFAQGFSFRKVLLVYAALLFVFCSCSAAFISTDTETQTKPWSYEHFLGTRKLLEKVQEDDENQPIIKKNKITTTTTTTPTTVLAKNQTKLSKLSTSFNENQTKSIKTKDQTSKPAKFSLDFDSDLPPKNRTKLIKLSKDSIKTSPPSTKKLNSTSKALNSTKTSPLLTKKSPTSSLLTKKSSDLTKLSTPKNKTTKASERKQTKAQPDKNLSEAKSKTSDKNQKPNIEKTREPTLPTLSDQEDEDDLVAGFRDLPSKFQESLLPDLERISTSSKVLYAKANKQITKNFKPYVGNKYAPIVASLVSFAFIFIPLVIVSLIFNIIKAYFSLQKLLIFIQVYLSIYFSILCLSSLITGLEPLQFFYATSQSTYVCLQVLQTLAYVLYLLLLLMYLVLVFSTETGLVSKFLGLVQTVVGFSVGLHYYMTVFHRTVLQQPPKTDWRVHAIYATCFLVICLLARADRRKKAYLEEGGGEGKKS